MFTISSVTGEQVQRLENQLSSNGVAITGTNPYTITGHGITATANFDETLGSLSVTVVHKPFYIPESAVQAGIEQALKGGGGK